MKNEAPSQCGPGSLWDCILVLSIFDSSRYASSYALLIKETQKRSWWLFVLSSSKFSDALGIVLPEKFLKNQKVMMGVAGVIFILLVIVLLQIGVNGAKS